MSAPSRRIRSLIVEDELFDRNLIEMIISTNYSDYIEIISSVGTAEEAIESIERDSPELLFLDIELNGDRGAAFNILSRVKKNFKIIFVTAKSEQDDLLKAIRLSCIDYLIKPTKISDFEAPIRRVHEEINAPIELNNSRMEVFKHNIEVRSMQEAKISLQEGFTFIPVPIKSIIRCDAQGNYSRFVLTGGISRLINGNLKSFEDRLTDFGFTRINKSELINLAHIKSFSRKNVSWEVLLDDGKTLFVSPHRKQSFLYEYNQFHLS